MASQSSSQHATREHDELLSNLDLWMEENRLSTFKNWPYLSCLVLPEDLAQSGFYYLGYSDRVQCISCKVVLSDFGYGVIIKEFHGLHSQQCKLVRDIDWRNMSIKRTVSVENQHNSSPRKKKKQQVSSTQSHPAHRSPFEEPSSSNEPSINQRSASSQQSQQGANNENCAISETSCNVQGAKIHNLHVGNIHNYYDQRIASNAEFKTMDPEKLKELQNELKQKARLASEDTKLPIDIKKPITPVTLEITTNLMQAFENPDGIGYRHPKANFPKDLASPKGDVLMENLFPVAYRRAEQDADSMHGSMKEKHILIHGNIVGVIGQAGIGKTTLTKMFTKRVLDEAILTADYLFYIPLRGVDFSRERSLVRFLILSSSCEWNHGEECDNQLWQKFKKNSKVVIIFDGLDEANMDLTQPPTTVDASLDKPENFIKNILTGTLLSHAKKLVTSRPRQFYNMFENYRPSFIVAITGLSKPAQIELCKALYGTSHTRIIKYMQKNRNIFDYCYLPIYCILTMYLVDLSFREQIKINLSSITSIFSHGLDKFVLLPYNVREPLCSGKRGEVKLETLCHLAWNGFSQKKILFIEEDLRDVDIGENVVNAFLRTDVDSDLKFGILEHHKHSYFSHLIWQEFFAAIELMFFLSLQEFRKQICNFRSNRWENVTKFMFGICNSDTSSFLCKRFPGLINSADLEEKHSSLKDFAFECMPAIYENDSTPALLQVCDWISEAKVKAFTDKIVQGIHGVIKIRGPVHSRDISNLNYVLRATQKPHSIKAGFDINMVQFADNASLVKFFEELKITLEKPNLKLTTVQIINSNICDPGMEHLCGCLQDLEELSIILSQLAPSHLKRLAQGMQECELLLKELHVSFDDENEEGCKELALCIPHTQKLEVRFSAISSQGYKILSEAIQALQQPLKLLKVRGNVISDDAAKSLSLCMNKVDSLNIEENYLTTKGAQHLSEGIKNSGYMLKLLKLNKNQIGDQGGIAISSCLGKMEHLLMKYCGITSVGVDAISTSLQSLQHPLHTLDLSSNDIGDTGANALSLGLKNIKQLILISCNITWRGVKMLSDAIANLEAPMEELNISFNKIGDEGIEAMSACLSKINHLNISSCDVTANGVKKLIDATSSFRSHSVKLTLDMNQIGDEGAAAISFNLNNIQCISIKRCGVTATGIKSISDSIRDLKNPMEELDISENNIRDLGIEAISNCLRCFKCLIIISCGMTLVGAEYLSDALNQLSQPMKKLSLKSNYIGSDGGVALSTCLQKVQTLNITQCNITGAGVMAMSKAIKALNDGDECSVVGLYAQ